MRLDDYGRRESVSDIIEITKDEALVILEELSKLPYREVQGIFRILALKVKELDGPKIDLGDK